MKRKIKKYLFRVDEAKALCNLLDSKHEDNVNLGVEMFIASKTYRHYIKHYFNPTVIRWMASYNGSYQISRLVNQYSHKRYLVP